MEFLENSWFARLTTETAWGFAINEIIHILSISVIVAVAVLYVAHSVSEKRMETKQVRKFVAPFAATAFAIALFTGFVFFAAWPDRYLDNPAFLIKMPMLITLAILNILIWRGYASTELSMTTKCITWLALAIALATIAAGRLIAYT